MFFREPSDSEPTNRPPWNQPWNRQPKDRYPYGNYRDHASRAGQGPRQAGTSRSYSRWLEDRETTRYLSARTQLSPSYASYVVGRVVNERFRALPPSYGVDMAVVAKWALASIRRRLRRDRALCAVLGIAVVATIGSASMVALWPLAMLAVVIAALAVGWLVVFTEQLDRRSCVRRHMLRSNFEPRGAPEPADTWLTDRLRAVSTRRSGNLVVFRNQRAFVGSGFRIAGEHLVIDVSVGRKASEDANQQAPATPTPFSNEEMHAAIMSAMKDLGLRDLNVEERLFVNGLHIQDDDDFLPSRDEPPTTWVNPALLHEAALHPTSDARVYVCVEMRGWQGQLVVTMFTRAVHLGGSLYIEWVFYVLPPVSAEHQRADTHYRDQRRKPPWKLAWQCARITPIALSGAPARLVKASRRRRKALRDNREQRFRIANGQLFNFGAERSIRELACGADWQHYFIERDEKMFVRLAQEKLLRAVTRFLDEKNVDLSQLDPQMKIIQENAYTIYTQVGDIINSNVATGKQAQASGGGNASGKGGGNPPK